MEEIIMVKDFVMAGALAGFVGVAPQFL